MPRSQVVTLLFVAALVAGLVVGPRDRHVCYTSDYEVAQHVVLQYENEAYPAWRRDHPDRTCPTSARELGVYMDKEEASDPWGRSYVFTCGPSGLIAMSVGADGFASTEDDVWSHRSRVAAVHTGL